MPNRWTLLALSILIATVAGCAVEERCAGRDIGLIVQQAVTDPHSDRDWSAAPSGGLGFCSPRQGGINNNRCGVAAADAAVGSGPRVERDARRTSGGPRRGVEAPCTRRAQRR
jgi:hypothetical protein